MYYRECIIFREIGWRIRWTGSWGGIFVDIYHSYVYICTYISCVYICTYIVYIYTYIQEVGAVSFQIEWRKCIGCLNLQVSFRTRDINYRALLQKLGRYLCASFHGYILFVCIYIYVHIYSFTYTFMSLCIRFYIYYFLEERAAKKRPLFYKFRVQGGEDLKDTLSCSQFSEKEPLNIGLFCAKMTYEDKALYDSTPSCSILW